MSMQTGLALTLSLLMMACWNKSPTLNFEKSIKDADILFEIYPSNQGFINTLPEQTAYLKSLDPKSISIKDYGVSLMLDRSGVESSGIVILRDGEELNETMGTVYEILSDRIYKWENRG